jgi:hypothetical protein
MDLYDDDFDANGDKPKRSLEVDNNFFITCMRITIEYFLKYRP